MGDTVKDSRTDLELINECLDGNQDCFSELYERYKNLVYSVVLRMTKDSEEAKDLVQDVFVKIYKNLSKYSSEFKFSTWVLRITSNHVIDHHRKKKFETISYEAHITENEIPTDLSSPESIYIKKEQTQRINKILADLPEIYRVPITLYHQQGLSYQEISDMINEPLSKVKNRIFRARKLLKMELENNGSPA